jgi:hypothetical protein
MKLKLLTFSCLGVLSSRNAFGSHLQCYEIPWHIKSVKHNWEVLISFRVYALSWSSWQVLTSFCVCSLNLSSYNCTWVHFDLCACFWHATIFSHFSIEVYIFTWFMFWCVLISIVLGIDLIAYDNFNTYDEGSNAVLRHW